MNDFGLTFDLPTTLDLFDSASTQALIAVQVAVILIPLTLLADTLNPSFSGGQDSAPTVYRSKLKAERHE